MHVQPVNFKQFINEIYFLFNKVMKKSAIPIPRKNSYFHFLYIIYNNPIRFHSS